MPRESAPRPPWSSTPSRTPTRTAAAELPRPRRSCSGRGHPAAPIVDLSSDEDLEVELPRPSSIRNCHHPYRQLRDLVGALPETRIATKSSSSACATAASHDELLRAFHAGAGFRFDILMDIGGFRDMHRHRRCTQIIQEFTGLHGYETPHDARRSRRLAEAGIVPDYQAAIEAAQAASARIAAAQHAPKPHNPHSTCFPWPPASDACSRWTSPKPSTSPSSAPTVAGHFSYRRVAWEMYLAIAVRHPALSTLFRIEDVNIPADLLKR